MLHWDHSMRYGASGMCCESEWFPIRAVGITMLQDRKWRARDEAIRREARAEEKIEEEES